MALCRQPDKCCSCRAGVAHPAAKEQFFLKGLLGTMRLQHTGVPVDRYTSDYDKSAAGTYRDKESEKVEINHFNFEGKQQGKIWFEQILLW